MQKKTGVSLSILIVIFVLAAFFRFTNLDHQGIIFYDASRFIHRSLQFNTIISQNIEVTLNQFYGDTKILWLTVLTWAQLTFPRFPIIVTGHFFSAFFGVLTVGLTFLFTYQLYRNINIALLSAAFLAISPSHIFYSRVALPESFNTFLFLLSTYFYLIAIEKKKKRWVVLSAITGGLSILTNRFRSAILPLAIGILEMARAPRNFWRVIWYGILFTLSIVSVSSIISLWFSFYGVDLPPYFEGIKSNVIMHATTQLNLESVVTFPYYIMQTEGRHMAILALLSILFIRKPLSSLIPLSIFMLQLVCASAVDEKVARSLSSVLPFLSILTSISLYHIYQFVKNVPYQKRALSVLVVLILIINFLRAFTVTTYKSDMKEALVYIDKQDTGAKIITSNPYKALVYWSSDRVLALSQEHFRQLPQLYNSGVRYIILDILKYVPIDYINYIDIERDCQPMLVYPGYSKSLINRLEFETNLPLAVKLNRNESITKDIGQLKIFELKPCLEHLKNK